MISAAADWVWQVPVLPVAFLVLVAALLAPGRRSAEPAEVAEAPRAAGPPALRAAPRTARVGLVLVAIACLVAIGIPLATTTAVRQSQTAAASGRLPAALADARTAARVQPGAASAQLQAALVLERAGNAPAAAAAAHRATLDEPINWQAWLIASRVDAEAGRPRASLAAYRRARALNPRSSLFHG